jgi:hypothetical protein
MGTGRKDEETKGQASWRIDSKDEIVIGNQGIRKSGCRIPGIRVSGKVKEQRLLNLIL